MCCDVLGGETRGEGGDNVHREEHHPFDLPFLLSYLLDDLFT
jgi:hypothetical protein